MLITAKRLKRDADLLVENGRLDTAYALLIAAMEEIAKIGWSKDWPELRQSHREKQKAAGSSILAETIISSLEETGIELDFDNLPNDEDEREKIIEAITDALRGNETTVAAQLIIGEAHRKKIAHIMKNKLRVLKNMKSIYFHVT